MAWPAGANIPGEVLRGAVAKVGSGAVTLLIL